MMGCARRIVDPAPAEVLAFTRRPAQRQNRGRVSAARGLPANPLGIVTSVPIVDWWRSDLGITLATGVAAWTGQKAGLVFSQATGSAQPVYSASDANFGGRPSLTADGVSQTLTSSINIPAPGTTPYWYWWIFRLITWTLNATMSGGPGAAPNVLAYCSSISPNMRQFGTTTGTENGATSIGNPRRAVTYYSNSASDYLKFGATKVSGAAGSGSVSGYRLFSSATGAQFINASLCELLITQGEPSPAEQTALDAYAIGLGYPAGILV